MTDALPELAAPPVAAPSDAIVVPASPHMPHSAVVWFRSQLETATCYLEYGSGGSTRLAAAIGVPIILTVESDRAYADAVRKAVGRPERSRVHIRHANIGPTRDWGHPVDTQQCKRWPDYALSVWDFIEQEGMSPDLILIDGRFRVSCFLASLLRSRPGTRILFDDYAGRQVQYGIVERFIEPTMMLQRCAVFDVPEVVPAKAIAIELARHVVRSI